MIRFIKIFIETCLILKNTMSFQNQVLPDGSININVIPSFGRIVNVVETDKNKVVSFNHNVSYLKSRDGREPTDLLLKDLLILTPADTSLSAQGKLSNNQSTNNTSMNTSKNLD